MRFSIASFALATSLWLAPALAALEAQEVRGVEILVPVTGAPGPVVRAVGVLDEPRLNELIVNGFPARLHWRLELWSAGSVVNAFEGAAEWDLLVRYDPIARQFVATRVEGDQLVPLGRFERYADAAAAAQQGFRVPLPATKIRRHYYLGRVQVQVLSLTDLREAELWLKGELGPAVRGEKSAGSAVGRFFRSIAARLLGSEQRVYEGRSATFSPG